MAVSLEVRVPFLDHPFVELMASVPGRLKIRGNARRSTSSSARWRPTCRETILDRKKAGFSMPLARWLREDLRGLVEDYLAPERLRQQGWFEPSAGRDARRPSTSERRREQQHGALGADMFQTLGARVVPVP